ncbi:hypothetical protein BKA64DRAFT_702227 [Cadophora sp. MPI-SDFR-AT-0126]|nr:hypothetical protein BKA64DRAFT_702227 [Leotiomycetes sp. MPI-SDFR-AT-0126]
MPLSAILEDPAERFGHEFVSIYVGTKRKEFSENAFKEGAEGVLDLPDDHSVGFALYVEWIYRATLPDGHSQSYVDGLYHLWIFADKLCLPTTTLKDAVMDKIQDISSTYNLEPSTAIVRMVFDKTPKRSHLRLYCIDVITFLLLLTSELRKTDHDHDNDITKRVEENLEHELQAVYEMTDGYPEIFKFLFYEAIGYAKMKALSDPRARWRMGFQGRCCYHEHADDVACHSIERKPPAFIRDGDNYD